MRIFTAIPLSDELKKTISNVTHHRLVIPYVNTENLHITLNFFGELDTGSVNLLANCFPEPLVKFKNFTIYFDRLTNFHNQIHITLKPNQILSQMQEEMEKFYSKLGFSFFNREYYPHVKLGNLHMDKIMNPHRSIENFPQGEISELSFSAQSVVLYESKLLLHHPQYIPMKQFALLTH